MRTPDDWRKELISHGLGPFVGLLLSHWQPCIKFRLEKAGGYDYLTDEVHEEIEVGRSKVGGLPDAPPTFEWPTIEDIETGEAMALPFLAQIRLEEVAVYDEENVLPRRGLLLFFFDCMTTNMAWQVVLVSDNLKALQRQNKPSHLPELSVQTPHQIHFYRGESLPPCYAPEIEVSFEQIAKENAIVQQSALDVLLDTYQELRLQEEEPQHQMLGHEATDNGRREAVIYFQNGDPSQIVPLEELSRWKLLLQLDEGGDSEDLNLGSGSGVIGFFIRNDDLQNGNFDTVYGAYLK